MRRSTGNVFMNVMESDAVFGGQRSSAPLSDVRQNAAFVLDMVFVDEQLEES